MTRPAGRIRSPSFREHRPLGRPAAATLLAALFLLGGCSPEEPIREADAAGARASTPGSAGAPTPRAALVEWPGPGKYGCAESIPRMVGGSYEYSSEGRGFLTVDGRGGYVDPFGVPGGYRYDAPSRESHFSGGALDGAVVAPLEGDGPRLWVVIPTESGERRWSCSLTEGA